MSQAQKENRDNTFLLDIYHVPRLQEEPGDTKGTKVQSESIKPSSNEQIVLMAKSSANDKNKVLWEQIRDQVSLRGQKGPESDLKEMMYKLRVEG